MSEPEPTKELPIKFLPADEQSTEAFLRWQRDLRKEAYRQSGLDQLVEALFGVSNG